MATGMEKKEIDGTADIFWSREPIMGPKGTKENPAIVPSFNTSRVVGLETEQARARTRACLGHRRAALRSTLRLDRASGGGRAAALRARCLLTAAQTHLP